MSFGIGRLASLVDRVPPESGVSTFALGLDHVESWTGALARQPVTGAPREGTRFEPGTVLFGKLRPYLAKVWVSDNPGVYIGDFIALKPKEGVNAHFVSYLMRTEAFIQRASATSYGSKMPRIEWDQLKMQPVSLPDPRIQRTIADYLDHETAEIDAFIADLERMQQLMEERREAERTWVLTDGSSNSEDGELVPWATDLYTPHPIRNIRRVATMKTGHTPNRDTPDYWIDTEIPWFTLGDVWQLRSGAKYVRETKELISRKGLENSAAELLPAGTVMLSRTASVGFTGIMPYPMTTTQHYWNWVCGPELLPEYLWHQFRAMRQKFDELGSGSTHKTIYEADAAGLSIVVPPVSRQHEILQRLDAEEGQLASMLEDSTHAITLAKERRAALISAAVTGQIDVTAKHKPAAEQLEEDIAQLV